MWIVDDILLEINDFGFETKTYLSKFYAEQFDECESIKIEITKDYFTFRNIEDCIYRLCDYAKGINFNLVLFPEFEEEFSTIEEFLELYSSEEFFKLIVILYNTK